MTSGKAIRGDEVLRVPEQVMMRELGGELVMLDAKMENYYGLNEVGTRLMQLAEKGVTLERIVEVLVQEYEVDRARLEADVKRLAGELIEAGLLERA